MLVKTFGSAVFGIDATTITIEVNVSPGIKFFLLRLPDNAVKESHYRISAALKNIGFKIPVKEIIIQVAVNTTEEANPQEIQIEEVQNQENNK